jgi:hypothetical protein
MTLEGPGGFHNPHEEPREDSIDAADDIPVPAELGDQERAELREAIVRAEEKHDLEVAVSQLEAKRKEE